MNFKISLRVFTNRANLRSLRTYNDMSALATLPNSYLALSKYLLCLYVVQQRTITLLMTLLNSCYATELLCQLIEAFGICLLGHGCIALTTWQIRRRREEEALQIIEK